MEAILTGLLNISLWDAATKAVGNVVLLLLAATLATVRRSGCDCRGSAAGDILIAGGYEAIHQGPS